MTNQSTSVRFLADELEPNHEGRISSDMVPVRSMLVPTMRAADVVEAPAKRKRSAALWITLLLLAALTAALTLRGFDFYRASTEARLDHPDYRVLSPTGFLGQGSASSAPGSFSSTCSISSAAASRGCRSAR